MVMPATRVRPTLAVRQATTAAEPGRDGCRARHQAEGDRAEQHRGHGGRAGPGLGERGHPAIMLAGAGAVRAARGPVPRGERHPTR